MKPTIQIHHLTTCLADYFAGWTNSRYNPGVVKGQYIIQVPVYYGQTFKQLHEDMLRDSTLTDHIEEDFNFQDLKEAIDEVFSGIAQQPHLYKELVNSHLEKPVGSNLDLDQDVYAFFLLELSDSGIDGVNNED